MWRTYCNTWFVSCLPTKKIKLLSIFRCTLLSCVKVWSWSSALLTTVLNTLPYCCWCVHLSFLRERFHMLQLAVCSLNPQVWFDKYLGLSLGQQDTSRHCVHLWPAKMCRDTALTVYVDSAAAGQGMYVHFGLQVNREVADRLAAQQAAASSLKLRRSKQQRRSKRIRKKLLEYKCTTCPHLHSHVYFGLTTDLVFSWQAFFVAHAHVNVVLLAHVRVALRVCQHLAYCQPASLNCVRSNNCLHLQAEKEDAQQSSAKQLEARSTEGAEDPKQGCRGTSNLSSSLACVGSKNDLSCCWLIVYAVAQPSIVLMDFVVVSDIARNVALMSSLCPAIVWSAVHLWHAIVLSECDCWNQSIDTHHCYMLASGVAECVGSGVVNKSNINVKQLELARSAANKYGFWNLN